MAVAVDDAVRAGIKNTLRSGQCVLHFGSLGQRQRQATGDMAGSRNRLGDGLAVRVIGHGHQAVCLTRTGQANLAVHHLHPAATRPLSCVVLLKVMSMLRN